MIKAIKFIFWTCVIAGIAFVVRITTTVKNNDIDRLYFNTADGQAYVITKDNDGIVEGVNNILMDDPDAVVVSETRRYANGDVLMWTTNSEQAYYKYVWHIPVLGRVTWRWQVLGQVEVPLREL